MANRFLPSRKWSSARLQVKLGWFDWYPSWQLGVHTPLGMIQLPSKQAGWREFITPGTCSGIKRGDGIVSQLGAPFCPKVSKIIFPWLADWAGHVSHIQSLPASGWAWQRGISQESPARSGLHSHLRISHDAPLPNSSYSSNAKQRTTVAHVGSLSKLHQNLSVWPLYHHHHQDLGLNWCFRYGRS